MLGQTFQREERSVRGVKTSVGEILEETLFEIIGKAFLADGAATKDASLPSGLRTLRGALRSSGLSKLEKIEVAALKSRYIAHLAEQHGADNISGGHATSGIIPTSVALKAREMLIKATEMMLAAGKIVGNDDVCHVRMSSLLQIEHVKKGELVVKILVVVSCLALGSTALAGGHGDVFSKPREVTAPSPQGHGDVFSKPRKGVVRGGHGDVFRGGHGDVIYKSRGAISPAGGHGDTFSKPS